MSSTAIASGVVVCCLVTIAVIVAVTLHFTRAAQESCTEAEFHDCPSVFRMEEQYFTTRNRLKIFDVGGNEIGSFTTQPSFTKTVYSYHDYTGKVVAQAVKSAFSFTYRIGRCSEGAVGAGYELERIFFTIGTIEYNLRKNGVLIGNPAKKTLFTCRPDVVIEAPNGTVIATASRSCAGSFFTDDWTLTNYDSNLENYVVGFIGYITTQQENMQSSKKQSK